MFFWRSGSDEYVDGLGAADWGFTSAGDSDPVAAAVGETPDFGAFNLGGHVGDDLGRVEANRRELAVAFGVPRERLLFMDQCHGTDVVRVEEPWRGSPPPADGIVTTNPALALAVLVADCVPVLLTDSSAGVVAAVHAGRPGMLGGIVGRAVDVMRLAGAGEIAAAVGPSVCGRCYEVPATMRDAAAEVSPASVAVSWAGTPAIDVAAGVVEQLTALDIPVTWIPGCTRESPRLYSYRRRSRTGRFAGVIRGRAS